MTFRRSRYRPIDIQVPAQAVACQSNNAFSGAIGTAIESIPIAGPILKNIGKFLDRRETFKTLENVLDRSRVYGRDFEKIGNRLENHG